jgi:hypothetical protein
MSLLHTLSIGALAAGLVACAPMPVDHAAHHHRGGANAGMSDRFAMMDRQMIAMHDMHEKMSRASPEERQALMADQMKLMHEGMNMMGGMGPGGAMMGGMGPGGAMMGGRGPGSPGPDGSPAGGYPMLEKRMQMMESMMQMMMDRMGPAGPAR